MTDKQKLSRLLDDLADKQKQVAQCHDYYEALEKKLSKKKIGLTNPEDYKDLEKVTATLNKEYEEKSDLLMKELNQKLMKGCELSKKIGKEISYDYKKLWDYMTQSIWKEVQVDRVLKDIDYIKKELF